MAQQLYKKIYNMRELYTALYKGVRTMKYMRQNKRNQNISTSFIRRIMLAVTEVNGCEVCSYAHTKKALEEGMADEEIKMLLSGDTTEIPEHEMTAIVFAQHYADMRGNPSEEAWNRLVVAYGREKALGILNAIRMIMVGNIYGIPLSAFKSRLKGKKIEKTTLLYEIRMILSIIILLPASLVHSVILNVLSAPIIKFEKEQLVEVQM